MASSRAPATTSDIARYLVEPDFGDLEIPDEGGMLVQTSSKKVYHVAKV